MRKLSKNPWLQAMVSLHALTHLAGAASRRPTGETGPQDCCGWGKTLVSRGRGHAEDSAPGGSEFEALPISIEASREALFVATDGDPSPAPVLVISDVEKVLRRQKSPSSDTPPKPAPQFSPGLQSRQLADQRYGPQRVRNIPSLGQGMRTGPAAYAPLPPSPPQTVPRFVLGAAGPDDQVVPSLDDRSPSSSSAAHVETERPGTSGLQSPPDEHPGPSRLQSPQDEHPGPSRLQSPQDERPGPSRLQSPPDERPRPSRLQRHSGGRPGPSGLQGHPSGFQQVSLGTIGIYGDRGSITEGRPSPYFVPSRGRAAPRQVVSLTGSSTGGGRVYQQAPGQGSGGQFPSASAAFGLVAGPAGPPQVVHGHGGGPVPVFIPVNIPGFAGGPPGLQQPVHVSGGGPSPAFSPTYFPGFARGPPGLQQPVHVSGGGPSPAFSPTYFPGFARGPSGLQQPVHVSGGGPSPTFSPMHFHGFVRRSQGRQQPLDPSGGDASPSVIPMDASGIAGGPPGSRQESESQHGPASAPAAPAPQARGVSSWSGVSSLPGPSARGPRPFVPRGAPLGYAPSRLPPAPPIEPPWLPGALNPDRPRPRRRRQEMAPLVLDDIAVPGAGSGGPEDPDPLGILGPSVRPPPPVRQPPPPAHPFLPGMGGMQGLPFGFAETQYNLLSDIRRTMENHRQMQFRGMASPPAPPRLSLPEGIPVNPFSHLEEPYQPEPPAVGQRFDVIPSAAPLPEPTRRGVVRAQLRSLNLHRSQRMEDQVVPGPETIRDSILRAYGVDQNYVRLLYNRGGWHLQSDLYVAVPVAGRASQLALLTDRAVPNPEGFSSDED
ncbi:hypothetical protein TGPRC2_266150 [Toxoplasma gondii TgCatPRC2]|uniref:Uncharacterized protein n=1 Tax=Toxoplasma gondii TgCatPRC2 TaxID=1130821 RepID=A0A151H5P1_TOXGO|nr:hypothetical protein TGPRC2_266150 [Toxoplasma gondii TgCatPRC2]